MQRNNMVNLTDRTAAATATSNSTSSSMESFPKTTGVAGGGGPLSSSQNLVQALAIQPSQRNGHQTNGGILRNQTNLDDKGRLQKELEKERAMRQQLEQHVRELSQKLHAQTLVENSYEDLARKYKTLFTQSQQMAMVTERYKSIANQLEQENRMLIAETNSLKAQENVAQDKTRLYNILMERSKKLEEENSGLVLENETHQRQYEKCIEDISKQVVQALLTQKQLQEQCLKLQERVIDLERENAEYNKGPNASRQISSESRLAWPLAGAKHKPRNHTASPSADSVQSMPAAHHYWKQDSVSSLEVAQYTNEVEGCAVGGVPGMSTPPLWLNSREATDRVFTKETEFPATDGSPKMRHRSVDRHPSIGSLDYASRNRGFIKHNGQDVRCKRSASAEALRDMRIQPKLNDAVKLCQTNQSKSAHQLPTPQLVEVTIHHQSGSTADKAVSTEALSTTNGDNDPFADDADDILSKHKSLIVGSLDDIFSSVSAELSEQMRANTIKEEELRSNSATPPQSTPPLPPPRPKSRSQSVEFLSPVKPMVREEESGASMVDPPPLPPKQYKGSRRPYKPLPAEPNSDFNASSERSTDISSLKQEMNELTSEITRMAASASY